MAFKKFSPQLMLLLLIVCGNFTSCRGQGNDSKQQIPYNPEEVMERNRQMLRQERGWIEAFIEEKNWEDSLQSTGSGSYYFVQQKGSGDYYPVEGDYVLYNCRMELLDGSEIYEEEERYWKIDRQDGEIGLHEVIKKLREGDRAVAILPSHLAYGIAGDLDEVPPRAPVVFYLEILKINP